LFPASYTGQSSARPNRGSYSDQCWNSENTLIPWETPLLACLQNCFLFRPQQYFLQQLLNPLQPNTAVNRISPHSKESTPSHNTSHVATRPNMARPLQRSSVVLLRRLVACLPAYSSGVFSKCSQNHLHCEYTLGRSDYSLLFYVVLRFHVGTHLVFAVRC